MSGTPDDPRCPECGGKIGQTATYCMHCSADLTAEQKAADTDGDDAWEQSPEVSEAADALTNDDRGDQTTASSTATDTGSDQVLDPDGLVDNTLTVVVGIVGGMVVGLVGTMVLALVTASPLSFLFGLFSWLGATAYLVRRRTVQGAVSKSAYAVALVLLLVPVIALSPVASVEGGLEGRGGLFVVLLMFVAVPAGISAAIGYGASLFVPSNTGGSEG